jgi:sortase A
MRGPRTGRSRRRWLVPLERLLLGAGAAAVAWYVLVYAAAAREQEQLSRELQSHVARTSASSRPPSSTDEAPPPQPGAVIGRVEVPRLRLSAMAREGVDTGTLGRAVGHVPGTALPGERGNAALAGHRDTFFRKLKDVRKGDAIVVTTERGRYRYVVRDTHVVDPADVWVLDPTDGPTLTLVTCYPFNYLGSAPRRFIVRASMEERMTREADRAGSTEPAADTRP